MRRTDPRLRSKMDWRAIGSLSVLWIESTNEETIGDSITRKINNAAVDTAALLIRLQIRLERIHIVQRKFLLPDPLHTEEDIQQSAPGFDIRGFDELGFAPS